MVSNEQRAHDLAVALAIHRIGRTDHTYEDTISEYISLYSSFLYAFDKIKPNGFAESSKSLDDETKKLSEQEFESFLKYIDSNK
ncbi:MAG: hypothetical protein ABF750_04050 [Oenococcus oeni]